MTPLSWFQIGIQIITLLAAIIRWAERSRNIEEGERRERERQLRAVVASLASASSVDGEWARLTAQEKEDVRENAGWYRD